MGALERLRTLATAQHRIEVPELGEDGAPLVAYFRTLSAQGAIEASRAIRGGADNPLIWARLMWECLTDADDRPIFRAMPWADFVRLVPPTIATDVGLAIYNRRTLPEDAAGN
ncbi:MAG: hypothetical protein KC464_34485 [Myxococcales bacterium]|nr:hypothetical protein [Myxococcales bacterium]